MTRPLPPLGDQPSVSAVIPMYNEAECIGHTLRFLVGALERHARDWEVVVVDDASTDQGPAIVAEAAVRDPRIRLLRHPRNRQLGGTLRTGFAAVTREVVFYTDADLAVDPEELGRALHVMRLTRADLVAGYRFDRVPEGLRRHLYSSVYNTMIGVLFGWPFRDINSAFKLFRREVLEAFELKSEGSLIDAELVIKTKNAGFVVQQIGVDYFPRSFGVSHLSSPAVILRILGELVRLYPEMRRPLARGRGRVVAGRTAGR